MSRPKIFIDARMVGKRAHGFSRYVTRLAEGLERLRSQKPLSYDPFFILGDHREALEVEPVFSKFDFILSPAPFLNPREWLEIPRILKKHGAALYHSPSFSSLLRCPCPWIITIHDLNHLRFGSIPQKLYYRFLLRPFARKARAVMTVSQFSRKELCQWLEFTPSQIEVVENALDSSWQAPEWKPQGKNYFFCLSNPKPHKNIALLVEAYSQARQRALKTQGHFPDLFLSFSWESKHEGVRCFESLSDGEIKDLIQSAGAVVFPSLYEGFGIPPVEATLLGVPVIASKIEPHQESLGEVLQSLGGEWFDPRSREDLTSALLKQADRGFLRAPASQVEAVRSQLLSRYSSARLAEAMDRIYRRVLGSQAE